jgi:hypothetical protein
MLNIIIDSWEVRAQKAAQSSQSSRSSFVPCHSEEQLVIKMLKESLRQWGEAMRQWDEYYSQALAQQLVMLQVSWLISVTIKHLSILSKLIYCITIGIANSAAARNSSVAVPTSPTTTSLRIISWSSCTFRIIWVFQVIPLHSFWYSSKDPDFSYSVVWSVTSERAARHAER